MRDIRDGRIASMTVDRVGFSATMDLAGKQEKMTGEVADLAAYDFDAAATLAMFDPARAKDDKVYRGYRQMKSGVYTASFSSGLKFRIEGMTANDIGIKPSKLQFPQLMAILEATPPPGTTPTPAQTRDLMEKAAGLYEGIFIGGAEVRGLSMETPEGPFSLTAVRLGSLDNGKLAEFALEGLDARSPQGPVKVGRFALKSLDIANFVRMSAQLATTRGSPGPEQLAAMLLLLEGTELRNLVAPYKDDRRAGEHRYAEPQLGPVRRPDPDAGTRHAENVRAGGRDRPGAVQPARRRRNDQCRGQFRSRRGVEREHARFRAGTGDVRDRRPAHGGGARVVHQCGARGVFGQPAAGRADGGAGRGRSAGNRAARQWRCRLAVANHARTQRLSRDDARRALVTQIRATAMQIAAANPDAMAIAGAITRFIETPRGTLTVKLTPRGKVPMMALIDAMRTDPMAALARFQVDASNGR